MALPPTGAEAKETEDMNGVQADLSWNVLAEFDLADDDETVECLGCEICGNCFELAPEALPAPIGGSPRGTH